MDTYMEIEAMDGSMTELYSCKYVSTNLRVDRRCTGMHMGDGRMNE